MLFQQNPDYGLTRLPTKKFWREGSIQALVDRRVLTSPVSLPSFPFVYFEYFVVKIPRLIWLRLRRAVFFRGKKFRTVQYKTRKGVNP